MRIGYNKLSDLCNQNIVDDGSQMIKNNLEIDIKVKCMEEGITQAQMAEMVGTSVQYVSRIINRQDGIVNKTFVQMLDKLGSDIQLTYVKTLGGVALCK